MAKKNVSVLVSAAGWIGGLVDGLVRGLRQAGVSDDEIHSLVTQDGKSEALVKKMVSVVVGIVKQRAVGRIVKTLETVVDYDQSIEDQVKRGGYDYANPDINSTNFPNKNKGRVEKELLFVQFDEDMETEEILRQLDAMDLRSGDLHDLLAIGANHKDEQREAPIIELASVWRGFAAYLRGLAPGRGLGLGAVRGRWGRRCRFLAFRK